MGRVNELMFRQKMSQDDLKVMFTKGTMKTGHSSDVIDRFLRKLKV